MNQFMKLKKLLARVAAGLSPSCKEAARLQSAALDRKLTLLERFGLRFHLLLCKWCRRYGKQITFLRSAAQHSAEHNQCSPPQTLSPEARERIKQSLQTDKE
jgi:hypothetical protein